MWSLKDHIEDEDGNMKLCLYVCVALSRNINYVAIAIDSQVCFHRHLFANPVKPHWCITGPVGHWGALIRIGVVPSCYQWPSRSILWIVYISVTYWGHSTTDCALTAVKSRLQVSHPPRPTPTPLPSTYLPLIHDTCDITGVVTMQSKKPAVNNEWQS